MYEYSAHLLFQSECDLHNVALNIFMVFILFSSSKHHYHLLIQYDQSLNMIGLPLSTATWLSVVLFCSWHFLYFSLKDKMDIEDRTLLFISQSILKFHLSYEELLDFPSHVNIFHICCMIQFRHILSHHNHLFLYLFLLSGLTSLCLRAMMFSLIS